MRKEKLNKQNKGEHETRIRDASNVANVACMALAARVPNPV